MLLLNEPFTDINGNGQWDIGEPFTDVNGNGKWDPAKLSPPTFTPPNSNQSELDFSSQGQQLTLLDSPGISFTAKTFLVGDFGNKTYDFLAGFSWSSFLGSNGSTQVGNFTEGALFTKDYADRVEKQFGYKKVEKLPTYLFPGTLSPGKVDPFDLSGLQPSAPFVAWTNNFPGVNPTKKPDTILGAFNQSGNLIAVNDDGGPFGSNWGSGIKSSVNNDGSLKLKVTGYKDFNFDGLNDSSGGPCKGGSGGGGCVRNAPHPQVGKYDLAVKMNQDYLPSRSSVSISSSNVGTNTRTFAARSINQEMSFSSIDVSDIASLYSDDLPNEKASSQKAEEDALAAAVPAEAVPEPTTGLGTLLALAILPVIKKLKVAIVPIGIIAVGIMTVTRPLDWSKPTIAQIMSSRSPMWTLSARGIKKRPLFGWGFDGFGIAYPYIRNPQVTPSVVNLDEFTYDYINIKGEISTREIPTFKAHNWVLDTTLSVGILGLVAGIALWGYYVCLALNYSRGGIEAVAIAYLIFTFTWFDGAQYAHIVWWMMSFAGVEYAYFTRFYRWRSQSEQLAITSLTFPASTANNSARSASYTP